MDPSDWEEIDHVLTRVFGERRNAPFEPPDRPRRPIEDPAESPVYYALQRGSPDERLVCLAACLEGVDRGVRPTTRTIARRTRRLARAVGWNEPRASVVAASLDAFAAEGLLERRGVGGDERARRWRLAPRALAGCPPSLVVDVAATDGHLPEELARTVRETL